MEFHLGCTLMRFTVTGVAGYLQFLAVLPGVTGLCFDFSGDSWLEFDEVLNLNNSVHFKFSMKTQALFGNIYYAHGPHHDFERLYLEDGILNYFLFNPTRYGNGGTYGIQVEGLGMRGDGALGPRRVADDQWHTVEFFRNTRLPGTNKSSTGIIVDGVVNADNRERADVIITSPFYIGGSDNHEAFAGVIRDFEEMKNAFVFHETSHPMNVKRYMKPPC